MSVAVGPHAHADSQGGDTSAKSGDAEGGDGGNAKAAGGDAKAGNVAYAKQAVVSAKGKHGKSSAQAERSGSSNQVEQGDNAASGGDAAAAGGNGGSAKTGNKQAFNGNSLGVAVGPHAKADSQGGDTSAKSGDAKGGDGGNAKAHGGDAKAGNMARVAQVGRERHAKKPVPLRLRVVDGEQPSKDANVLQNDNAAIGGDAEAAGGEGGDAFTGNVQKGNGNALAWSEPRQQLSNNGLAPKGRKREKCKRTYGASATSGDTSAKSGDAEGGDGGNAQGHGGDAVAGNVAKVRQRIDG